MGTLAKGKATEQIMLGRQAGSRSANHQDEKKLKTILQVMLSVKAKLICAAS